MALCQRYFERFSLGLIGSTGNSTVCSFGYRFTVAKRAIPTMTGVSASITIISRGVAYYVANSPTYDLGQTTLDTSGGSVLISGFSGLPTGYPLFIVNSGILAASAEL